MKEDSHQKEIILPSHKTKIICTIGPSSQTEKTIKKLVQNGMTIARLNFSHGTLDGHKKNINLIHKVAESFHQVIPILVDLPGSKIRIGILQEEPIALKTGEMVSLTSDISILGTQHLLPVQFPNLPSIVHKHDTIFLNDGFIELQVQNIKNDTVECQILMGGPLLSHKGINFPQTTLSENPVTSRDFELIDFALKQNIDTFCVSFIRDDQDIIQVKNHAKAIPVHVIAKIERREALTHFQKILKVADGIMIARGDLGIQVPLENVPTIQKQLIREANIAGCPVITATQMLKSMTDNTRPTRAEVTDVANAILDGTDAIMLSEETAIGKYPVKTVQMMAKIATVTEQNRTGVCLYSTLSEHIKNTLKPEMLSVADVISLNVMEAQKLINPRYILITTASGSTARRISRFKPECWILAFTRNKHTHDFLPFCYGVYPFHLEHKEKSWHDRLIQFISDKQLITPGDRVILTQRRFAKEKGGTDSLGIITIDKTQE